MKFADGFWLNQRGYEVTMQIRLSRSKRSKTDSSLWQHLSLYTTEL